MKGAVASGHRLTSEAACEMLEKGGNAFDAVVAAGFTSVVAEPTLTSLAGGGFLLIHENKSHCDRLIDFFVNTPGIGCKNISTPPLMPVDVRFKSTIQRFHIGIGSVAVPGTLKGLIHCYDNFCSMYMDDLIKPALRSLKDGIEVTETMAYLFHILEPIMTYEDYGRDIYNLKEGDKLYNPLLLELLSSRSTDKWIQEAYSPQDWPFDKVEYKGDCLITREDFAKYEVIDRDPLVIPYRGHEILTNPPPSFGGTLLKLTFTLLNEFDVGKMTNEDRHDLLASIMKAINEMREEPPSEGTPRFPFEKDLIRQTRTDLENIFKGKYPASIQGTTHISVMDSEGNAASMTASNGSNSGCFLGNTGIMLNNMMGEDDLHPFGFYSVPPGRRVSSMMSPSLIKSNGDIFAVMGSGGSKRIRTAIPQAVVNLIDKKMNIHDAVESPRLHYDDDGILQIEPGFDINVTEYLKQYYDVNPWEFKDMYFGGVHTVLHDLSGEGDSRRGGYFMKV